MKTWFSELFEHLHSSYWFVPSVMAAFALLLSYAAVETDRVLGDSLKRSFWLYTGHPDGALQVLSTIATAMITIATLTFSVTIVALTLAASQYGSRLLYSFMRDRANQVVLGVFVSAFLYTLLVLRAIDVGDGAPFVPQVSVTVALVLALVGVAALIYFIHHIAEVIQADNLIAAVSSDLAKQVRVLCAPADKEAEYQREADEGDALWQRVKGDAGTVEASDTGFLQAIDIDTLQQAAVERDLVIRVWVRPGEFVTRECALLAVFPATRLDDALVRSAREAFALGPRRTLIQDLELPFQQLAEIAVRSLSPSLHDPFTALRCIARLADGLDEVMARSEPRGARRDAEGRIRLLLSTASFGSVVEAGLTELRTSSASNSHVMARLLDRMANLVRRARTDSQRKVLLDHAQMIYEAALPHAADVTTRETLDRMRDRLAVAAGSAAGRSPIAITNAAPPG